jgi:rod shape-determining protein MreC
MVFQNNYQRATLLHSTGKLTGTVYSFVNNISSYFTLRSENDRLIAENARLQNLAVRKRSSSETVIPDMMDTIFQYISARVISNTVTKQKNYLILDKGRKDGIHKDMGVITSEGVVGTVIDVSDHFSRVMSVLHITNKINARIKKNNHLGSVTWEGKNYRQGLLTDIPSHVYLVQGDTIVTSGNSFIFPAGILIGTVDTCYADQGGKFNTARIDFSADHNRLFFVYIIENQRRDELRRLENMQRDE